MDIDSENASAADPVASPVADAAVAPPRALPSQATHAAVSAVSAPTPLSPLAAPLTHGTGSLAADAMPPSAGASQAALNAQALNAAPAAAAPSSPEAAAAPALAAATEPAALAPQGHAPGPAAPLPTLTSVTTGLGEAPALPAAAAQAGAGSAILNQSEDSEAAAQGDADMAGTDEAEAEAEAVADAEAEAEPQVSPLPVPSQLHVGLSLSPGAAAHMPATGTGTAAAAQPSPERFEFTTMAPAIVTDTAAAAASQGAALAASAGDVPALSGALPASAAEPVTGAASAGEAHSLAGSQLSSPPGAADTRTPSQLRLFDSDAFDAFEDELGPHGDGGVLAAETALHHRDMSAAVSSVHSARASLTMPPASPEMAPAPSYRIHSFMFRYMASRGDVTKLRLLLAECGVPYVEETVSYVDLLRRNAKAGPAGPDDPRFPGAVPALYAYDDQGTQVLSAFHTGPIYRLVSAQSGFMAGCTPYQALMCDSIDAQCDAIRSALFAEPFYMNAHSMSPYAVQKAQRKWLQTFLKPQLEALSAQLTDSRLYFLGSRISTADLSVFALLSLLDDEGAANMPLVLKVFPVLAAFHARMLARPAIAAEMDRDIYAVPAEVAPATAAVAAAKPAGSMVDLFSA